MTTSTRPPALWWSGPIGFLLILGASLALTGFLAFQIWQQRREPAATAAHIYVISGRPAVGDGALFQLEWTSDRSALSVRPGHTTPTALDGTNVTRIARGSVTRLIVGDYHYDVRLYDDNQPDGTVTSGLKFDLVGVRIRLGDEVGRAPDFFATGRMTYDPERSEIESARTSQRPLRLWLDGLPVSAFRVVDASRCVLPPGSQDACIGITGGAGRITHEKLRLSPPTRDAEFEHPVKGAQVPVSSDDRLWIGHLQFEIRPVTVQAGQAPRWDLTLASDYRTSRGERRGLGGVGFTIRAPKMAEDVPIAVSEITNRFTSGHLSSIRWDPESEDDYQLMIDAELLCVETQTIAGAPVPQLAWADAARPGCANPLPMAGIAPASHTLPESTLEIYRRRRGGDLLVSRTNDRLRRGIAVRPEDLPFVFEWWPRVLPGGTTQVPVRVWGVRTMATLRDLDPHPAQGARPPDFAARPIVIESRDGRPTELARSDATRREYHSAALNGLGPLLGIRGAVDGLDSMVGELRTGSDATTPVRLTIDTDLQRTLWATLKNVTTEAKVPTTADEPGLQYGISGVVLNATDGAVLAALNWPSGLWWEDQKRFDALAASRRGMLGRPLNDAMLRADKVGSVLKLLTMYTMADSGALDAQAGGPAPVCEGGGKNKHGFGVLATDARGVVSHDGIGGPFGDKWRGVVPVGASGMEAGLDASTGTSCNTYFGLAATLLLSSDPPEAVWRKDCRLDIKTLERSDDWRAHPNRWVFCETSGPLSKRLGGDPVTHWVLLPGSAELLRTRAIAGVTEAAGRRGYFGHALGAGYRFLYKRPSGNWGITPWRPAGTHRYRSTSYVEDWFGDLGDAEARVFNYPAMASPASYFNEQTDQIDGKTVQVGPEPAGWRSFASQAVGENGQASALSVAVLYSAIARDDGRMAAPRLIASTRPAGARTGGAAIAAQQQRPHFANWQARSQRLRTALLRPLRSGGTAARTVGAVTQRFADAVFAKTGTFDYARLVSTRPAAEVAAGCGVLDAPAVPGVAWGAWLGTSLCEDDELSVTRVHRYPVSAAVLPSSKPREVERTYTAFASVLIPPNARQSPPLVVVLIADIQKQSAAQIASRLVPDVWAWMNAPLARPQP
jgi:hypothetical protein